MAKNQTAERTRENMSDWQWYSKLVKGEPLTHDQIYKSCVAVAVHGRRLPQESSLSGDLISLLEVRRLNNKNLFSQSISILGPLIDKTKTESNLVNGDALFLKGIILNRLGEYETASYYFSESHKCFSKSGETHRALRAVINAKISERDLNSSIHGELLALEQEARRSGCFDLVGNIAKARAIELGVSGKFNAAALEAQAAVECYLVDGFPEDLAVAQCLVAIFSFLSNDKAAAERAFRLIKLEEGGKLVGYLEIYNSLVAGRCPALAKGHPLATINWKIQHRKEESVTGKILARLKQSPATRDEIIEHVWGDRALDPSYHSRFFSALTQIRRTLKISVTFDGSHYRLN